MKVGKIHHNHTEGFVNLSCRILLATNRLWACRMLLSETCFMSNLVEMYWRHVRDFFQRIAGVCFGNSSNTDPTFQGFINFVYSKESQGLTECFPKVPTWRLGREALCGGGEDATRMPERSSKRPCWQVRIPLVVAKHRLHHLSLVTYFAAKSLFIFCVISRFVRTNNARSKVLPAWRLKPWRSWGSGWRSCKRHDSKFPHGP